MAEEARDTPEYEALNFLNYGTEPDLVSAAVAHALTALPEWSPRAGNAELVLMESLAVMLGPEILSLQLVPGQIVEQLLKLYGVVRGDGDPVRGRVQFDVTNSAPTQVIPAGTRLRLTLPATSESVDFLTAEELSIITTETLSGQVDVYAEFLGQVGNLTPADTVLDLVDALPFVEQVRTAVTFTGGAGPEDDVSFQSRASATLARLTSTLVLPENFQYAAASREEVGRAKVFDMYDPANPTVDPAVGHVSVAVAGPNGEPLTAAVASDIATWLSNQALASLLVHVINPTYTTVDIAVTVKPSFGFTAEQVQASVEAQLRAWLDARTWDWNPVVGQYAIVAKVAASAGVAEVTAAPADIPLAGKAPLPVAGSITVTVV